MRARRRVPSVVAVAAVAAALAFGVPAGASVAGAKSGCKLLKKGEVSAAIGREVKKAPKPQGPPTARVCGYTVVDSAGSSVNLWVESGSSAQRGFATAKEIFAEDSESIPGFGKKAFYVAGGLNTLYVLKGETLAYVQYVTFDPEFRDDQTAIKDGVAKMMKIVLKRA